MSVSTQEMVEVFERLPDAQRVEVADFARFLLSRQDRTPAVGEDDGDAAWERIIADPRPRPKLKAYVDAALAEGGLEPLDPDKL